MFNDCIKLCESEHSAMCGRSFAREFKPTRLIDCKTSALCAASNSQYACLSYVWGDAPVDNATSNNQTLAKIPQTVSDAMFVTLQLGMRYLWVDRYCIDQDNLEEKHDAIRNMDSIYGNAFITIIAAAGSGSDYGLPGVSRLRKATPSVRIGSHAFMVVQDPLTDIEASIWNTRGWTYQEMLLSRRRLIFTDRQVYFQCQTRQTMEQLNKDFESTDLIKWMTGSKQFLPTQKECFTINDIYSRLEEYYVRTLRYKTDNINAFAGVFRDLSGRTSDDRMHAFRSVPGLYMPRSNPHFYGIPLWLQEPERVDDDSKMLWWQAPKIRDDDKTSVRFGLNLGWRLEEGRKSVLSTHDRAIVKPDFPSWSWASAKDQRLNHGQCRLVISSRPDVSHEIGDANFSASVTHRSGERMSMLAYTAQADDYTRFYPWIDVVAYTISGHLRVGEHRPYIFSELPDATVYLDNDQEYTVGKLKALYIGMFREPSRCGSFHVALFLLLKEAGQHEFRRIGLCTMHDGGECTRSGMPVDVKEGFHLLWSRKRTQLEKLEATVKWGRKALRII
ncbi:HET-domain-containing protein [Cucurbitaria berberidis CBS 394.84]|uniref:HET-domain-containing protein n=1 Tax=Cucurbitaria berberidis CBS 394.84 TaxID=1168544 RepID=A0A9P4L9I2_9PLEO|nr:HET-domain-containing protein [Cucurbitaria berberidis CBS 394.84]KAF1846244.1 HET-domain-containing protein [Cucurbitaria berberidis CBS 394.84]